MIDGIDEVYDGVGMPLNRIIAYLEEHKSTIFMVQVYKITPDKRFHAQLFAPLNIQDIGLEIARFASNIFGAGDTVSEQKGK